ncbi:energy transducer TonB [Glaciecola sp. SC05]|uniref:energy transducer TonB n=1 Tax=Glaciecola sp. SC05 TaxID=1987355 RepID=UPI003528D87E
MILDEASPNFNKHRCLFAAVLIAFCLTSLGCKSSNANTGLPKPAEASKQLPDSAQSKNKPEGWVMLEFDINTLGEPVNISVLESVPARIFDKEAVRALTKWKYKPKIVDGVPVVQKDLKVRLDFTLVTESQ